MARIDAAHLGFLVSMWGKGALGASQIAAGLALAVLPAGLMARIGQSLIDPGQVGGQAGPVAGWIAALASQIPTDSGTFYIVYFLLHGVLNLGLVLALLADIRAAYPLSILTLIGFIVYQMAKYSYTPDVVMLLLSAIDTIVILLIWREWRLRHAPS